jgi:hypothetical protein
MDLGIIIAIGAGTVSIVGVMIALMFWCRGESNALRQLIQEMQLENKDFHFRLLEIERERIKLIKIP